MARGRKPKPTHLRLLEGNKENRPLNLNEPKPIPIRPVAPKGLSPEAREEWDRIADETYNLGLLTTLDVQVLAAYCQSYGRWIVAERKIAMMAALDPQTNGLLIKTVGGHPIPNPLIYIAANAARDMVRYAAEFGFTPAARTRIAVESATRADSKFAGLLG